MSPVIKGLMTQVQKIDNSRELSQLAEQLGLLCRETLLATGDVYMEKAMDGFMDAATALLNSQKAYDKNEPVYAIGYTPPKNERVKS